MFEIVLLAALAIASVFVSYLLLFDKTPFKQKKKSD